ncbi:MAG: SIS domain-containing protein [Asgard group archaeon]|nr:SIS domain-containing protein [Asgard group archaeon]
MPLQMEPFNRDSFIQSLQNAIELIPQAEKLGKELSKRNFNRLFFVGCGAPNRIMLNFEYWIQKIVTKLEIRNYFPAEFINQNTNALDDKTLVILGSYSGTTKETIEAAEFLKDKPCTTLAITRLPDLPLAKKVQYTLLFGETKSGDYSRFILALAFLSSFLSEIDPKWNFHKDIISSLQVLPKILADTIEQSEEQVKKDAEFLKDKSNIYVIGSGPMYGTAYILAKCALTEMQWLPSHPIIGAEFFHGPFEVFTSETPVITLVGEDPSRSEAERVVKFCKKYTDNQIIYDARDYLTEEIKPIVKGIISSIVVDAATRRLIDYLAEFREHDKSKRKYMGKVDY